ncbi:hypothetical protein ABW20_dc0101608 [Dactylellina cionopaga]|nr:hypothetical protein ABW20_dc0101608 [Dactylellina cionopaga]
METTYDPAGNSEGVFATETLERAVAAYSKAVKALSPYSTTNNKNKNAIQNRQNSLDENLDEYSWLWQVCTEFGAFQVSNTSRPENLLPSFINTTQQIEQCIETFGESDQVSWAGPNVDPINQKYQGWYVELSNTLWTNGEFDPWRALSVASEEADAPTNDTGTTSIPKCGTTFPTGTQLRYIIQDGYHGSEFAEDIVQGSADVGGLDGLNPTATIGVITATITRAKTATNPATSIPVLDASNAQSLWFSALSSWLPCTTLDYAFTAPAATTSGTASSRTPFPTDEAAVTGSGSGNKKNAGATLALPSLMIPFIVSFIAFIGGVRVAF